MEPREILALPMDANDADAKTIGEYLGMLLLTLWEEDEGFSGKRAFGNSGWKHEVYTALVRGGALPGTFLKEDYPDSEEYLDNVDSDKADDIIYATIRAMFGLQR